MFLSRVVLPTPPNSMGWFPRGCEKKKCVCVCMCESTLASTSPLCDILPPNPNGSAKSNLWQRSSWKKNRKSEIAKPRVRKPRVFINWHMDPPPEPRIPPPKTCPCRSLHSAIHSYTVPYKEGRVFRDLEGGFWGVGRGAAIYETRGFRFLNPGFRNLRENSERKRHISEPFAIGPVQFRWPPRSGRKFVY